jgi:mannose-6-phosphate isomerase-like protein (cupin superfamily)
MISRTPPRLLLFSVRRPHIHLYIQSGHFADTILSTSVSRVVLAVSNPKISRSAVPLFPGGPRVYVIAEPPRTGNRVGLLFLPCEQATAQQRVSDCALVFYVVSGKVRVNMALERCGGKRARFTVNKGGAWEVPCRTTYSIENSLSMTAQLFFWRWRAEDDEGTGDSHHLHMPTECGDRAARHA